MPLPDPRSLDDVFRRMPDGWSTWDAQRTAEFKAVMRALQHAGTLPTIVDFARRAAPFYGIDPQSIGGEDR